MTFNAIVDAVFVTYNPNLELLEKGIDSLRQQVRFVYVIDNTPDGFAGCDQIKSHTNVEIVNLLSNQGIALAQNVGIRKSLGKGSDFVVLCDQDTIFPVNYIDHMVASFLADSLGNICAMAPIFNDAKANYRDKGFICFSRFGFRKILPRSGLHQISQAIASGLLIKSSSLEKIGYMDENLFIDWVDIEWCWRAISRGYTILGNADLEIDHHLGDRAINVGYRHISLRNPIRHYYITRNAFYLATRCKYLDLWHRLTLFLKSFRYIAGYTLFSKPHVGNFRYTMLGFYHGITGRLGKL